MASVFCDDCAELAGEDGALGVYDLPGLVPGVDLLQCEGCFRDICARCSKQHDCPEDGDWEESRTPEDGDVFDYHDSGGRPD